MPRGRPKAALSVTPAERATLDGWARGASTPRALAQRALIVLACAEGNTNAWVAVALGLTPQTVGKWRERFVAKRLRGLADAPRSGAPPRIRAGDVEWALTLTLLAKPRSSSRWSAHSLGEVCGMSPSGVARIWHGFGVRPGSTQPAHCRSNAKIGARFESLTGLYLDERRRARARVHRVTSLPGLHAWLAECDAAAPDETGAELILCECGSAAEAQARHWHAAHPRFGLHVAPGGALWRETLGSWFAIDAKANAPAGADRIGEQLREAIASGGGFEGGTAAYAWSGGGEQIIRTASGLR